ncbi:hypothetical protein ECSTECDG1313_0005 [Escherichia coli STEC_DG131-3]|nr:hypothetical protein ECSTECDG1313_0005 [Escherichia coli STEC_DG131-3]
MAYHSPDVTLHYPYLRRMSWAQITAAAEDAEYIMIMPGH